MARLDRDDVDFAKLEQDVFNAIESEAHYKRENDAKFRAVNQKVANYEEFRDIVLASHLKPLSRKDKMPEVFVQAWNTAYKKPCTEPPASKVPAATPNIKDHKIPTSSLGLVNAWRRLSGDSEKLAYLLAIGGAKLKDIFKTEISGGLLGDILQVLVSHSPESAGDVTSILEAISEAKRFKLDLQFITVKEKEACEKLFLKLSEQHKQANKNMEKQGDEGLSELSENQRAYEKTVPTEQDIDRLKNLFEVTL